MNKYPSTPLRHFDKLSASQLRAGCYQWQIVRLILSCTFSTTNDRL